MRQFGVAVLCTVVVSATALAGCAGGDQALPATTATPVTTTDVSTTTTTVAEEPVEESTLPQAYRFQEKRQYDTSAPGMADQISTWETEGIWVAPFSYDYYVLEDPDHDTEGVEYRLIKFDSYFKNPGGEWEKGWAPGFYYSEFYSDYGVIDPAIDVDAVYELLHASRPSTYLTKGGASREIAFEGDETDDYVDWHDLDPGVTNGIVLDKQARFIFDVSSDAFTEIDLLLVLEPPEDFGFPEEAVQEFTLTISLEAITEDVPVIDVPVES